MACWFGHEGVVKQLLALSASVSDRDVKFAVDRVHATIADLVGPQVCHGLDG